MEHLAIRDIPHLKETAVCSQVFESHYVSSDHDHEFYEVAMVRRGTATHQSGGISTEATEGDVFIIPRGVSHAWLRPQNLSIINIYYNSERFLPLVGASKASTVLQFLFFCSDIFKNPSMSAATRFKCSEETFFSVRRELEDVACDLDTDSTVRDTFQSVCFLKAISFLARDFLKDNGLPLGGKVLNPAVYRLLEILNQHAAIGEVPSIGDHAERLGVSLQHLTRMFSEGFGEPPFKYFNRRRLECAKELLRNNAYTSTEIAHRFGFCDSAHFTRNFKESFKITPSEYRRQVSLSV
jgi:AraC-like DNA-binding protein